MQFPEKGRRRELAKEEFVQSLSSKWNFFKKQQFSDFYLECHSFFVSLGDIFFAEVSENALTRKQLTASFRKKRINSPFSIKLGQTVSLIFHFYISCCMPLECKKRTESHGTNLP